MDRLALEVRPFVLGNERVHATRGRTVRDSSPEPGSCASRAMAKPTKKKRSESEDAGETVVVSEVMLRTAALAYAAVANLDPSDPRWRRCWCALRLSAVRMVAAESKKPAATP